MKNTKYYTLEDIHDQETIGVLRICTVQIMSKRGTPPRFLKLIWTGVLGRELVFNRMEVSFLTMKILAESDLLTALSTITHNTSSREVALLLESQGFVRNSKRT